MDTSPTIQHIHGRLRSITSADPSAGAEISETVDTRRRWLLRSAKFTLVADAGGAARIVTIFIDDGTTEVWRYTFTTTVAGGVTRTFCLAFSAAAEALSGSVISASMPSLPLGPGYRIKTSTANIAGGDDYGAPQLLVEEWIDP